MLASAVIYWAIAVAEVVPVGIVGVVACAHGVEVKLFHQLDILKHALLAHHISAVGVELVAVGALYQHGLAVDEQLAVLYLHAAEAHIYRYHLSLFPFGEGSPQSVQVGESRQSISAERLCQMSLLHSLWHF